MSIEAMMWVKKHAPTKNATEMCILYALADRANDDGTGCWPYYETLADESRCSLPTIKRHIKALEERGLIVRGDQREVAKYPKYRRPVVWDLNMKLRREAEEAGCQSDTSQDRGINGDKVRYQPEQSEVSTATDRGITVDTDNHPLNHPSTIPEPSTNGHPPADRFEEFYDAYDRKKKRPDAERAWSKAAKKVDPQTIIDAAQAFIAAQKVANKHPHFTPYPATWLNAESWNDEIDDPQPQSTARGFDNSPEAWGIPSGATSFQDAPISFGFDDYINHEEIS